MIDLLIKNGLVVDGTGRSAYQADVAVYKGKIRRIAPVIKLEARNTIDAAGLVVAPGFIDYHSHSDAYFLFGTDAYNMLEQGITTGLLRARKPRSNRDEASLRSLSCFRLIVTLVIKSVVTKERVSLFTSSLRRTTIDTIMVRNSCNSIVYLAMQ